MKKYIIIFSLILIACNNNNIVPQNNSQVNVAKEYVAVFLNDDNVTTIESNKPKLSLILFGMDGCSACFAMKNLLSEKGNISNILLSHYKPYYINLSHKKEWIINNKIISIDNIKKQFNIVGTPTLAITYGEKILLIYPGYIDRKRLEYTLNFFLNEEIYKEDMNTIYDNLKKYYVENNI